MSLFAQIECGFMVGVAPSAIGERLGLDEDQVIGKAARLWGWSIEAAAPDGIVRGDAAVRSIERAVGWLGPLPRGQLVDAFVEAGILERVPEGIRIKGWLERYGNIHDEARSEKARKAALARWGRDAPDARSNAPSTAPSMPDAVPDALLGECSSDARSRSRSRSRSKIQIQDPEPPPTPSAPDGAEGVVAEVVDELVSTADPMGLPTTRRVPIVRWEPTGEGCWEFIQLTRELNGLHREEPRRGNDWAKFTTWFARAMERGGQEAITDIVSAFVRDRSIRTPGWPTSVLIKAWDVRLEAWLADRAA